MVVVMVVVVAVVATAVVVVAVAVVVVVALALQRTPRVCRRSALWLGLGLTEMRRNGAVSRAS